MVLFYSMVGIGIATIIFGIKDLFFEQWEGVKNLTGILFGLSFTGLLLYGWIVQVKSEKSKVKRNYY